MNLAMPSGRFANFEPPAPKTTLEKVFREEPVDLDTFVSDPYYIGSDWELSPLQRDLVVHMERIYLPELYPLMADGFGGYWEEQRDVPMKNLLTAQWGKGGGKDGTVRVGFLRCIYLLLCLNSPQKYFGMPIDDSIHLLNIAVNSKQAHRAFFAPMRHTVQRGWFEDKSDVKQDTILFDNHIEAISGHSDAESQEGLNLIVGVADEIDAFRDRGEQGHSGKKSRESSTSAESILELLQTSASTRFPRNFKRVAISFPRYKGSMIQRLTEESKKQVELKGPTSRHYASGPYATWEVNPTKTKEMYADDYEENPALARAKYECKPSLSAAPYYRNPEIFTSAEDREEQPITIDYKLQTIRAENGNSVKVWEPVFHFAPDFKPTGGSYVVHCDLAISGDRAGIAMSHVMRYEQREVVTEDAETGKQDIRKEMLPVVRNDFTIGFEADKSGEVPREIQIRWARTLIFELIRRGFRVVRVTYDSFQSVDSIQQLTLRGLQADRMSTDRDQGIWRTLRDVASEDRLKMPHSLLLQTELQQLTLINRKVDHPPTGSKDLADAFACSVASAIEMGGSEDPLSRAIVMSKSNILESGSRSQLPRGMKGAMGGIPRGMHGGLKNYGH